MNICTFGIFQVFSKNHNWGVTLADLKKLAQKSSANFY